MRLTSSPIFEIVRLIDLQPEGETGFCMLVDPPVETNFIADVNRSRLDTGGFLLFRVDLKTAGRFLDHAPNIRSFIGTNIFQIAPDPLKTRFTSGSAPGISPAAG